MNMFWDLVIINQSQHRIAKKKLHELSSFVQVELAKRARRDKDLRVRLSSYAHGSLTCVFLSAAEIRKINYQFRNKNKVTDVLSFESPEGIGELLFCLDQIKAQAQDQGHSVQLELSYMFIHGVLHLLGYDHEKSHKEETRMFTLQNAIFNRWRNL